MMCIACTQTRHAARLGDAQIHSLQSIDFIHFKWFIRVWNELHQILGLYAMHTLCL